MPISWETRNCNGGKHAPLLALGGLQSFGQRTYGRSHHELRDDAAICRLPQQNWLLLPARTAMRTAIPWVFLLVAFTSASGCHRLGNARLLPTGAAPIPVSVANPSDIGNVDPDFLWRMIADAVDDHFRIDTEQPVRRDQQNMLEGRLTTFPEVSGTVLEPWRGDTARGFERLQSTFQTIRRTATVRVIPNATGYQIHIEVLKEQEDVDQSQFAAAGAAAQRHDGSIVRNENQLRQLPVTLGWFEIGRDRELELRIMEGILGRITNVEDPAPRFLHH